jgi:selenoprotein W-related protein
LAAELAEQFPEADITLIPSSGGRFEVLKDGVPVYEKSKLHRHAVPGEVATLLRTR